MKRGRTILLLMPCLAAVILIAAGHPSPPLSVPLADGSSFELTATDIGKQLMFGGNGWQRILSKIFRHPLPRFVRYQPMVVTSFYTNGIGLQLDRKNTSLDKPWNGTGRLYYLDESGVEQEAHRHCVNFILEPQSRGRAVMIEEIDWEIPMSRNPELNLVIRETNKLTGAVSTHPFKIKNPAR